ncbi:MAG: hypothetical protein FWF81_07690 [Defluviitaleaceae bacterium]|nr:hypothetical protein [Defluviitaleaceae bacterium]
MFNRKGTRNQMVLVAVTFFAMFLIGHIVGRLMPRTVDVSEWEIFQFESPRNNIDYSFEVDIHNDYISVALINTGVENLLKYPGFTVVKQADYDEWRVFPFSEETFFAAGLISLPPGLRATYELTENMLIFDFIPGQYRIVTEIWHAESEPMQVWTSFELHARNASH